MALLLVAQAYARRAARSAFVPPQTLARSPDPLAQAASEGERPDGKHIVQRYYAGAAGAFNHYNYGVWLTQPIGNDSPLIARPKGNGLCVSGDI
jgi:hypothetical protein